MRNDSHAVRILCSRPGCCFLYSLCCVGCPSALLHPCCLSLDGCNCSQHTENLFKSKKAFLIMLLLLFTYTFKRWLNTRLVAILLDWRWGKGTFTIIASTGALRPGGLFRPFNTMKLHKRGRHYTSSSIVLIRTIFLSVAIFLSVINYKWIFLDSEPGGTPI